MNITSLRNVREEATLVKPYEIECQIYSLSGKTPFARKFPVRFGKKYSLLPYVCMASKCALLLVHSINVNPRSSIIL